MKKKEYKLNYVDCANCGIKIEDNLKKLEGVHSADYAYMIEKLIVLFDENLISEEMIEKTILKTIVGVRIVNKRDMVVSNEDIRLTQKKNDKVKMILFRKKRR